MSAFVVDYKTINRILSKLKGQVERGGMWESSYILGPVLTAAEIAWEGQETWQTLGMALLAANVDAVQQRYPDDTPENLPGPIDETLLGYRFDYDQTSKVQAVKSLGCLLYQMAEGAQRHRPLYKALQHLEGQWAIQIVHDLPEYESAAYA